MQYRCAITQTPGDLRGRSLGELNEHWGNAGRTEAPKAGVEPGDCGLGDTAEEAAVEP